MFEASKEAMEDFHKENPYFIEMKDALLKIQILFMEIQNHEETEEEKEHFIILHQVLDKRQSQEFERIWKLNRLDHKSKVEELWLIENEIKIKFQRYHDFLRFAYNHDPINEFCFPQQVQHKIKHLRTKIKFFQELYGYFYV
ncbi:uncharacterized protein PGTG_15577 [Puccinia graminis f. sp. tritici CRL 75-36-700-3]|uniref:Uncharacterized protein n=1 Tax=Puccinia graminis f. sp. tritici (strain CRL 75-36-700-3 / race SCCL) TaxID=418459 RepID=E3KZ89_PUCGT|nr:uncharacterized protein PGTG_15577 [Puccinia graminis f. sp. tritici CRL 75-36-700-3]EFP89614.1 hypothetical protein PGTG_15577 [Puccinia graminis f. sp. tritici CRL 75-36-700-3]